MGISVAMVGLGAFGRHFVPLFQRHPEVDHLAICDIDADRVALCSREFGIDTCYTSLDEVLRSDVDAVVLITQPWLHFDQAMKVLKAGKHVYSAVPPVYGTDADQLLGQVDDLVNTVRRTGLNYMLGETTYFRREIMYCRRRAISGDFGFFTYAECEYWHDVDSPSSNLREVARRRWGGRWEQEKRGGIPMFYPTHAVGGVVSVMGSHMVSVSAGGYLQPGDDWYAEDTYWGNAMSNEVALYRASNGALVRHCEFRRVAHPNREGVRIMGTEGCFMDGVGGAFWTTRAGAEPIDLSDVREPLPEALAGDLGGHGGSHAYLAHEFVDSCVRERLPRISVWQAARYLAPGIVAHQSALRDGEVLPIPDWGDPPV